MAGKFELKKSAGGKFMFSLKAANGRVILTSETYSSKAAAQGGIDSVKKSAGKESSFDRKASKKGEPYFVLKAANGEIVGSSEMYSSNTAMEGGIASVKENARGAAVEDLTA
jgi:uncharacterized protein YegP (UPF0339 family)